MKCLYADCYACKKLQLMKIVEKWVYRFVAQCPGCQKKFIFNDEDVKKYIIESE